MIVDDYLINDAADRLVADDKLIFHAKPVAADDAAIILKAGNGFVLLMSAT